MGKTYEQRWDILYNKMRKLADDLNETQVELNEADELLCEWLPLLIRLADKAGIS